jgi:hypothetical protein
LGLNLLLELKAQKRASEEKKSCSFEVMEKKANVSGWMCG